MRPLRPSSSQTLDRAGAVRRNGAGRLGLNQVHPATSGRNDEIDLEALLVAKVVDLSPASGIRLRLRDFRCDEPFEQRPEERRPLEWLNTSGTF
jgi:hypothetical protein